MVTQKRKPKRQIRARVAPQPGPQIVFASTPADIAIFGGSAGSGKSFGLQLEVLRHTPAVPGFEAVYFRRHGVDLEKPGAAWDEGVKLFPRFGGVPGHLSFEWPGAGKLTYSHLSLDSTVYGWQSSQLALIIFDELTQFSRFQFFYMLSRNRSTCGVRPYVRCGCNPDADSWVAEFLAWWINQETGFPIPERAGVLRYFIRGAGDALIWADSPEELAAFMPKRHELPPGVTPPEPLSVTFVPAKVTDNVELLKADPQYLANLLALPLVERERLYAGNWAIRPAAGLYFKRHWVGDLLDAPPVCRDVVRYWDLAATEKTATNDPDWTIGVKLGRTADKLLVVLDVIREQVGPFEVEQLLRVTANQDGPQCKLGWGVDPGQAGKSQTATYIRLLQGQWMLPERETGDKITRFGPMSAQARAGNLKFVRARWNEDFFRCLEGFPDLVHDDDVDALAGAGELMFAQGPGMSVFEFYRKEAEQLAAAAVAKPVPLSQQIRAARHF